ncbi:MAG: hypothetical protein AB1607_12190 [Chloroflexota bacterium]
MAIDYERDLLKHHVRANAWLPLCQNRLRRIRSNDTLRQKRRLRYFTFCAVGAMDVLMLDVAKVIKPSKAGRFDTVVFFDKTNELVQKTQQRIPGAIGFPGDFVKVVLLDDPDDGIVIAGQDSLLPQTNYDDDHRVRQRQILVAQHQGFIRQFPFDVINLDLEEFLFKPSETLPGRVINAMRRVFEWQGRSFVAPQGGSEQYIDGFSLMFTTRIGPENISAEYLNMLRGYVDENLRQDTTLLPLFQERTGGIDNVATLQQENFELFFLLAMPKVLSSVLIETDWYIDPVSGITIYEFERTTPNVEPYRMLHLVMDVKRQLPIRNYRPPRAGLAPEVQQAYQAVVHQIFTRGEQRVTIENIDRARLQAHLDRIIEQRRLYCPDQDQ